jgi:hypothetical protein
LVRPMKMIEKMREKMCLFQSPFDSSAQGGWLLNPVSIRSPWGSTRAPTTGGLKEGLSHSLPYQMSSDSALCFILYPSCVNDLELFDKSYLG